MTRPYDCAAPAAAINPYVAMRHLGTGTLSKMVLIGCGLTLKRSALSSARRVPWIRRV